MQCLGPLGESQAWATGSVHYMVNNRCVKKRDLSHPSIWGGRRYEMHRYLMKEGALVVGQQSQPVLQHKDFSSPGNCNLFCSLGMSTQPFIQHTSEEPYNIRLPWDTCDTNFISFARYFSFSWACLEVISHVLVPQPGLMMVFSIQQQFPLCLPAWRASPAAATYLLPCSDSTSQLSSSF